MVRISGRVNRCYPDLAGRALFHGNGPFVGTVVGFVGRNEGPVQASVYRVGNVNCVRGCGMVVSRRPTNGLHGADIPDLISVGRIDLDGGLCGVDDEHGVLASYEALPGLEEFLEFGVPLELAELMMVPPSMPAVLRT